MSDLAAPVASPSAPSAPKPPGLNGPERESLFGIGAQQTGAEPPDEDTQAIANIRFLADSYGKDPEEVADQPDVYRQDYANKVYGAKDVMDDATFYTQTAKYLKQQRDERPMLADAQAKLFDSFRTGERNWRVPFTSALADMKGKPGYDVTRLDLYRHLAEQQWNHWQDAGQHYPAAVDAVGQYLNLWTNRTGSEDEQMQARQAALHALQSIPEDQQDAVLGLARRGLQNGRDGVPEASGAEKTAGRLEQGIGTFASDAMTGLSDVARAAQPGGTALVLGDQYARRAERKLDNALTGQADPYHGDSWLSEATLGAAEGLPRMLAMFHPAGWVANVGAFSEEARGHFEDAGVDPAKAAGLGLAASIPLTALQAVSSKTMVGDAATAGMEAWMVKNLAGKTGTELVKGYAKNMLAQSAENTALLAGVTAGQQLTQPAVQAVGNLLDGTIPAVKWTGKDGELTKLVNATPETLASLVPLIVLGTGMGTLRNYASTHGTVQNEGALRAVGLDDATVKQVLAAKTPEDAVQTLQDNFKNRTPAPDAVAELNAKMQPDPAQQAKVSLAPDGTYLVKNEAGVPVDSAGSPEMAAKAVQDHAASNVIQFPGQSDLFSGGETGGDTTFNLHGGDATDFSGIVDKQIASREAKAASDAAQGDMFAQGTKLSDADRAAMRAEESSQLDQNTNEISLKDWIKGKLPHPETAADGGEALAGELKMLRDFFIKEDKKGRLNYGDAAKWFSKKGEYRSLDDLTQAAREAGFNFQTPADLLTAVDSALRGKDQISIRGSTDESAQAFGIAAGGGKIGAILNDQLAKARAAAHEIGELPEFKGFKEVLNKWTGDTQLGIMHTEADVRNVIHSMPDAMTRKAMGRWLDAGGDVDTLQKWRDASSKLEARKEYDAALKLKDDPQFQAYADKIRQWFNDRYQKAVETGIMKEKQFRENYLTQLIERPFVQGGADSKFGQQLNKNFKFSKERVFPNMYELEKAGYSAKTTDVAEIMARYDSALNKAILSRQLVKDLLASKNASGEALAVPLKGTLKEGEGDAPNFINNPRQTVVDPLEKQIEELKQEAAGLKETISNSEDLKTRLEASDRLGEIRDEVKELQSQQTPEDAKLYKSIDHPALRKWWWMGKDAESGKETFMEGDIGLHPDIRNHLENALGTSELRQWYDSAGNPLQSVPKRVVKALDMSNGFLKRNLLGGLSLFHAVHEYKRALGNRVAVNPLDMPEIKPDDARTQLKVRTGLMLASPHDVTNLYDHKAGLGEAGSLIDKVPGLGKISKAVSEYTFQKLIPGLKSAVWDHVYDRNLETFKDAIDKGEATKEQVAYLTSHQINARFGHQNLADIGRDPTMQHILQIATLAPDFWESNLRNYGQDIKGLLGAKTGREPAIALATTAAVLWTVSRVMNKALDDDWHFDEPFSVIAGGRTYTMRNEVEDIVRFWKNNRGYMMGRLSPTSQAAEEWISNRNWRGEKIDSAEVLKNWISKVFPMSLRFLPGIKQATDALETGGGRTVNVWQQFLGSLGVQVARHSPLGDAYKLAGDWKKAQGDKEDTGTYPVSKFQQLRYALEDEDMPKAREEWTKLTEKLPAGKVTKSFHESLFSAWTGSHPRDQEFRASLSDADRAKIEQADQHRQKIWQTFQHLSQ